MRPAVVDAVQSRVNCSFKALNFLIFVHNEVVYHLFQRNVFLQQSFILDNSTEAFYGIYIICLCF